ncbi:saccharopine dehydrogenase NADP-binding domain-containing protein [Spirosoma luteolum]
MDRAWEPNPDQQHLLTITPLKTNFLIYGAYGYTGRLIVELAVSRGHQPVVAGRDADKTRALAGQYGLPYFVFDVTDTPALTRALTDVQAVLHCGGPFALTAPAMVEACLQTQTHYLDITGEIEVFEHMARQHDAALAAGITLLPGVGFDVVPSDCLALHLKQRLRDATDLQLAFKTTGGLSRGTALTALHNVHRPGMIRRAGSLTPVPAAYEVRQVAFDGPPEPAVLLPWGDVSTAFYSTGIPNIRVFMAQSRGAIRLMKLMRYASGALRVPAVRSWLTGLINRRVTGPAPEVRQAEQCYLWGQVSNPAGYAIQATLITPEAYHLTAQTALLATERVLAGTTKPGFFTPASAFGADFILQISGTTRPA